MKKLILLLLPAGLLLGFSAPHTAPESTPAPNTTDTMVQDRDAATKALTMNGSTYAWDLFVWLNSPVTGPDAKRWEHWKPTSEVYLPDGATPQPWDLAKQPLPPPEPVTKQAEAMGLDMSLPFHNLDAGIQVDGLVLKDKWNTIVRYQLLMNQPTFDYILAKGLYNINGQEALAATGKGADFPWNSWELKTSWIWLGDNTAHYQEVKPYYYVVNAYYQKFDRDGEPDGWATGRAAMSGMHIINKTLPDWVWITFENVHNPTFTQVKLELPISQQAQNANKQYQTQLGTDGSIFANYQLDGVQANFTQPLLLANSQIESAFQSNSSCISCHGVAAVNKSGAHFSMVKPDGGNLTYYTGDLGTPRPYVKEGYVSLDFVFSLKRAHRKR